MVERYLKKISDWLCGACCQEQIHDRHVSLSCYDTAHVKNVRCHLLCISMEEHFPTTFDNNTTVLKRCYQIFQEII